MTSKSAPFLAALAALLVGCGTADTPETAADPTTAERTTTAARTTYEAPPLTDGDIFACQRYVDDLGEEYEWLVQLRDGDLNSSDDFALGLRLLTLGSTAAFYLPLDSPPLSRAFDDIITEGEKAAAAVNRDSGISSVEPRLLIIALRQAAEACEEGGFAIDWAPIGG